jgi:NADH-quinone oxidoreductase subunit J
MARYAGVPLGMVLTAALAWKLWGTPAAVARPLPENATRALSMMLFREYVLPFELTSILILIAILGAVVLAKRET